jgi:hypothetical protein
MYKANQNFRMSGRMVRRNDLFETVDQAYLLRGLVSEVKIVTPELPEVNNGNVQLITKRRGRKPKAKTQQVQQSDE